MTLKFPELGIIPSDQFGREAEAVFDSRIRVDWPVVSFERAMLIPDCAEVVHTVSGRQGAVVPIPTFPPFAAKYEVPEAPDSSW
jgi:hypothetical protein